MSETDFTSKKTSLAASENSLQDETEMNSQLPLEPTPVTIPPPPTQTTSPSETESTSELEYRHNLRQKMRQTQRIQRTVMAILTVLPLILASLYLLLIAVPRYEAESRFSVRTNDQQSQAASNNPTSLVATSGSTTSGSVDGWAVNSFLDSRDAMHQLDKKIGLRRYLARATYDPMNRLPPDASDDALYEAYRSMVSVSYNMLEQINIIKVNAFSPEDAHTISLALLDLAQEFVHNMDEKGISNALKVSREAVTLAEQQAREAMEALTNWRIQNGNIDPAANAAMQLTLIGQLETELNTAYTNFYKIRALNNPDHPMLDAAKMQVDALQNRLKDARHSLSLGDTEASQLKTYDALKNAQLFADANLATARQNYQQSFVGALQLRRYLSIIAQPQPSTRPSSPDISLILIGALIFGVLLAVLYRLIMDAYHFFRHV